MKLFLLSGKFACQLIKNTLIAFGMYICRITVIVIKAVIKGRKDGKSFLKTNTSVKTNQPARDLLPHPKLSHNNVFSPLKGNEIWKLNYSGTLKTECRSRWHGEGKAPFSGSRIRPLVERVSEGRIILPMYPTASNYVCSCFLSKFIFPLSELYSWWYVEASVPQPKALRWHCAER